jgi:hypothetical protein
MDLLYSLGVRHLWHSALLLVDFLGLLDLLGLLLQVGPSLQSWGEASVALCPLIG